MNTDELLAQKLQRAARAILEADGLLITAGAGMGVDSGLPDFRGKDGFWNAYPVLGELGISFSEIATPEYFYDDPTLAWGFYGHRLNLYRKTVPHQGFQILREIAAKLPQGAFVVTSNVDGHFQKAGFHEKSIYEVHGSIHRLQCFDQGCDTRSAETLVPKVNEEACRLVSVLPRCHSCDCFARPNILMFNDMNWNSHPYKQQQARMNSWLDAAKRLVIIEIGAGHQISTIRRMGENQYGTLIRINPKYDEYAASRAIAFTMGGLSALQLIQQELAQLNGVA
jgi:NAD-dependent SIR2 family protein deacetylase